MRKLLLPILLTFLSVSDLYAGYRNPVIRGFFPDPSVCRAGDDYYVVNSSFQYFPGVPILHSRDLVNWEQIGNVLTRDSQLRLDKARSWSGVYAPTIRFHGGMFYMITTNVSDRGNFIVHTADPAGEWSDPAWVDVGGIDPSLFWDEDGTCWYTGSCDGRIILAKIDPMSGSLLSEPKPIFDGTGGRYPEAPHLYRKDRWYYLLIAQGGTEMGHGAVLARSRRIDGPYTPCPTEPLMTNFTQAQQTNPVQGVGHADFVQTPHGDWFAVCLGFRRMGGDYHMLGRETFLAPVEWPRNGWPTVNGDGHISIEMDADIKVGDPYARKTSYDFRRESVGPEWVYMRNPVRENYRQSGEGLVMTASHCGLDDDFSSPTFLGRRQEDQCFEATMCLVPGADESGLTVYQDCGSHYDIYVTSTEVKVRFRLGLITEEVCAPCPTGDRIWLRVRGTEEFTYAFSCSADGKEFADIAAGEMKYLSTEAAGGFTGVILGMFATGEGSSTVVSFDYRP